MLKSLMKAAAVGVLATLVGLSAVAAQERPDVVVAVQAIPPTLEPAKELSNQGVRITYSMFDTLIRRDSCPAKMAAVRPSYRVWPPAGTGSMTAPWT